MEGSDLEKLTPAQRDALPKGERMFLAPMDESTGKGEEIQSLCRLHGIPASTAHDLISVHGYGRASDILDRTQNVLARLEEAGDTTQALPMIADADASVRSHEGRRGQFIGVGKEEAEVLPATVQITDERCTSFTRVALHAEADEHPEYADVPCYLNEGHEGMHRGWHAAYPGNLSWVVVDRRKGA